MRNENRFKQGNDEKKVREILQFSLVNKGHKIVER